MQITNVLMLIRPVLATTDQNVIILMVNLDCHKPSDGICQT